ncbi:MAG TPA: serine/threonine-protein kinase [Rhodothermales bacterium]|nr:serine/threonine-protein kinase [Rhodothermales bacterium]
MDSERWKQVNAVLDEVLDLPPGRREAYLETHYKDDPALQREVASLLAASDEADDFLAAPAKDYAATLISRSKPMTDDALIGQEIDGYQIQDVLGRGGMGIVYKALDVNLDKEVALKMIDPTLARDATFVRRFRSEARALARIDSRHIVRVHAMRQTDERLFIVMEYVDGGTVTDLINTGPIAWSQALPIIQQMLMALEQAHGVGVVHRDIKPSNIMLTRASEVKVTDFGLAKLRQTDGAATVTQGIAGTLFYMSPEQVRGLGDLDHRSDLYSMGMTIYQMLTGELPIDRDSGDFAIMRSIVEEKFPPPSKFKRDLPPSVVQAVMKALEKDPDDRFQSAAEMRYAFEALQGAVASDAKTIVDSVGPYRPPKKEVNKNVVYAGAGVGGLVVLILLAWLLWPDGPSPALLSVSTDPGGAEVMVDGSRLTGTTPLDYEVPADVSQIHVRIFKTGYADVDTTLDVKAGETLALNGLQLVETAQTAMLEITSSPGEARVYVNGRDAGVTGVLGALDPIEVPAGAVIVRVEKDKFEIWTDTLMVEAGASRTITPTLVSLEGPTPPDNGNTNNTPRTGTLTVDIGSGNGSVSVAGEGDCRAGESCSVRAGPRQVSCGSETFSVTVPAGGSKSVACYFDHEIVVQVRDAAGGRPPWATIKINGEEVAQLSDKTVERGPGTYTVSVSREGYTVEPSMRSITLKPALQKKRELAVFQLKKQ